MTGAVLLISEKRPLVRKPRTMLYKLGRLLQFAGLVILPVAISGNVAKRSDGEPFLSEPQFLGLAAIGVLVFVMGWLIQQVGRPR
jgi:hypothetical protein